MTTESHMGRCPNPPTALPPNHTHDNLLQQIYLLVAGFLKGRGHESAANLLIKSCENNELFPPTYNWAGEPLLTVFAQTV